MKQQSQSIDTAFAVARRLASRACLASGRNDGPLPDLRSACASPSEHWKKVSRDNLWLAKDPELALAFPFPAQDVQYDDPGMRCSEPLTQYLTPAIVPI